MPHNEQNFVQKLRSMGYRLTPQRQIIMDILCDMGGHATINDIYEQVHKHAPAIDRATVYRTIHFFHEHQMVFSATINGQTMYEIAAPHPHHHLVCRNCHQVTPLADYHFHDLTKHLREEYGFQVEINHLALHGLCATCLANQTDY